MMTYFHALCWAAAMFAVAAAGAFGVIDEASATTLLIVLPAVAWIAVSGRSRCLARRGA